MAILNFVDYNDPNNRRFKVPIDGIVKGYTFYQMEKWTLKWDDPLAKIRRSSRYAKLYKEHYNYLLGCFLDKKKRELGVKYLIDGLTGCIQMFESIQNEMSPEEEFYKSFTWEAKVTFFSYFDFCKQGKSEKYGEI